MFRPEMLAPMGLPDGVQVLGWGLSLERPTMIRCVTPPLLPKDLNTQKYRPHRYGINNIRTLVGHKVSIESVEKSPAVRF